MMKSGVEVSSLRVVRGGKEVLRDLTFSVGPGEVTGLLGPSGCGKTTLMRAIVGVQRLSGGASRCSASAPGRRRCAGGSAT